MLIPITEKGINQAPKELYNIVTYAKIENLNGFDM
jgi:hypothetical protein